MVGEKRMHGCPSSWYRWRESAARNGEKDNRVNESIAVSMRSMREQNPKLSSMSRSLIQYDPFWNSKLPFD